MKEQAPTYTLEQVDEENFALNLGPQHPGTHGVLRVILHMDGEYILYADQILGYGHRMQEKVAENMTYLQVLPSDVDDVFLTGVRDFIEGAGRDRGCQPRSGL
jgi:NADH-quinone oxidoreductase subunit D